MSTTMTINTIVRNEGVLDGVGFRVLRDLKLEIRAVWWCWCYCQEVMKLGCWWSVHVKVIMIPVEETFSILTAVNHLRRYGRFTYHCHPQFSDDHRDPRFSNYNRRQGGGLLQGRFL
ncbi:hypothetical protein L2E82_25912 [Cichorium intybus]|uniref:Uncharacterized protein n=1 Tax=Cichorium intybus TaxID=13427 RepID=A0ACB9E4C9_CICIN|nr:hypothetical protein L2E82_25912 [Cichorium intybus]